MATQKRKKPSASNTYEALKTKWYSKLAKSGFEDIEQDEYNFKKVSPSVRFKRDMVIRNWHAKSEYYSMAGQFLHNYQFDSKLEKIIWDYHSNAISARDIATTLNKTRITKTNKDYVNEIIQRLVKEMKKMYLTGYKE